MQKYGFDDARPVLERASRPRDRRPRRARRGRRARSSSRPTASGWSRTRWRSAPPAWPTTPRCPRRTTSTRSTPTRCAASTPTARRRWSPRSTRPARTATPSAASSRCSPTACRRASARTCTGTAGSTPSWPARSWASRRSRASRSATGSAPPPGAGSQAHDEMERDADGVIRRRTGRAGGTEGGMSTGEVLRVRAAMKPISTVPRALRHGRRRHRRGRPRRIHQRSDVCAVPAAGVVAEAMVALVLADAVPGEVRRRLASPRRARNHRGYLDAIPRRCARGDRAPAPARSSWSGRPGSGKTTVGRRAGRAARASPLRDTDADDRGGRGPRDLRDLRRRRRAALPRAGAREPSPRALAEHDGVAGARRRRGPGPEAPRPLLAGHTVVFLDVGIADAARRVGFDAQPPAAGGQPARASGRADGRAPRRPTSAVATVRASTPPGRTPDEVADEIVRRSSERDRSRMSDPDPASAVGVGGGTAVRRRRRHRPARRAARPARRRRRSASSSCTRARWRATGEARPRGPWRRRASRRIVAEVPDAEEAKTARGRGVPAGRCSARPASPAPTPSSASAAARRPTSPASSRRPGCAASRVVQVPDDAARHGRRGGRRQDRHQHRRGQEPRRRVPPAGRGAVRPRDAGDAAAARLRRPGWPRSSSAASSPTR